MVTDSTSDIPPALAQELGIVVVPLNVHFGDKVYRDGLDLSHDEFYRRLVEGPVLPRTSQPAPGVFAAVYRDLAQPTDDILSIHISAKLSGTYNSALLGRQEVGEECRIEVVDSQQASMSFGLVVIAAAEAARDGQPVQEVLALVHDALTRVHTLVLMDTLEYLYKGGRIGKAQALLGALLHIKPLITVRHGEAYPVARERSRARALERMCQFVQSLPSVRDLALVYSTDPEEAEAFGARLDPLFPRERIRRCRFGPVMGTYLGPRALGVAVLEG